MKKFIRILFLVLLVIFVILQFFQPEKNSGEITSNHIFNQEKVPENIQNMLQTSCMDCHSDQTRYLWYHKISPVSFMVNEHIVDGKHELNFSEWGEMDIFDKIGNLEEICQEAERKKMPLKSYTFMHPKAKLSAEQLAELCLWTENLSEKLLKAIEEE